MFFIILALLVWETGKSINAIWHWRREYAYYREQVIDLELKLETCEREK
jgi:hypothetical protein